MHIPVKCSCGECQDWAIVELQGSFEIQNAAIVQNLAIGSLCRSSEVLTKKKIPSFSPASHQCQPCHVNRHFQHPNNHSLHIFYQVALFLHFQRDFVIRVYLDFFADCKIE